MNKKSFPRRTFLLASAALGGAWFFKSAVRSGRRPAAMEISRYLIAAHADTPIFSPKSWSPDRPGFVRLMNLQTKQLMSIGTPITAHVFCQNPASPHLLLGVSKHARGAVVVDVQREKTVKLLFAPLTHLYYGHGCFSPDGQRAFITAQADSGYGKVCVYNTADWTLIDVVLSGGANPHDCAITDDNRLLVVNEHDRLNSSDGNVALINLNTLEIERKFKTPMVAHAYLMGQTVALSGVVENVPTNIVTLNLQSGALKSFRDFLPQASPEVIGEGLSVCKISVNEIGVTVPNASQVIIWDLAHDTARILSAGESLEGIIEVDGEVYLNSTQANLFRLAKAPVPSRIESAEMPFANGRHLRMVRI